MKSWLTLALTLAFVTGCTPGDPKAKTVRQRVLAGETVTFTKPGYTLCGKNAWTDMRLADSAERERVVLGKQSSVVGAGHSVCYRIGDTIPLNVNGCQLSNVGRVRIDALSLVLANVLNSNQLKGSFFASSSNFEQYRGAIKPKPDQENMVTVADVTYIKGSANDEAYLRQAGRSQDDGYEETVNDGDLLSNSTCKKPYTYIAIPGDIQDDFTNGKLQSWYTMANFSCLVQGATVDLSTGKNTPPVAQVKITKIKKFRAKALDPKFFVTTPDYDFEIVRDHVAKENNKCPDWMVVVDFALVPPPAGAQ